MHLVWKKISEVPGTSMREIEHSEAATCARQAGAELIETMLGVPISPEHISIIKDAQGKPSGIFDDLRGVRIPFSLSIAHAFPFVLAASAEDDVLLGGDVERERSFSEEFITDFLTEREYATLKSLKEEEQGNCVIEFWALKEAILKAFGVGLRVHPRRLEVDQLLDAGGGEEMTAYLDKKPFPCRVWQGTLDEKFRFCVVAVFHRDAILSASRVHGSASPA